MTSKTTTKATRKNSLKKSQKKSHRINRQRRLQRRLQKQLQMLLLERHSRKCIICHHPEREAIEEEFLHWRAPWKLAEDYNIADYRTIYRHARAAGILLKRRENLHSALDAFVEAVDDVKFTPDSILRAMRAYSCIDRHGRWTEIPTQVHISTFHDVGPTQSPARNSSVIDIDPDQLEEAAEDEPDDDPDNDAPADDPDDTPDDDNDPKNESEADSLEENTACAASPAQSVSTGSSNSLYSGRTVTATACAGLPRPSRGSPAQRVPKMPLGSGRNVTATTCAAPPAQAPPRNEVRGHNPKDRSPSDRTACAASPAQPAAPQKPKPDADGLIWHKRPGYPNQEVSEPDAQGRICYKISMTPAASQLPPPETDARRAAELIYRSAIKKCGNP